MVVAIIILLIVLMFLLLLGEAGSLLGLIVSLGLLCLAGYIFIKLSYSSKQKRLENHIKQMILSTQLPYGKAIKIEEYAYLVFRLKEKNNYDDGEIVYSWVGESDEVMKLKDISCCLFYENGVRTKYCGTKNADPLDKPSYDYYIKLFSKDFRQMGFWPGKQESAYEAYEAFEYILTKGKSSEKCPFEYFNNTQDTE